MELRYAVVLASGSPRRRELLGSLAAEFEVCAADLDERAYPGESPAQVTVRLATEKAQAIALTRPDAIVIGGDTLVALPAGNGWEILGKPVDIADARRMLRSLSGRTHVVTTGVCVLSPTCIESFAEETRVTFRELTPAEIDRYAATGESLDKAGAYAIQGLAESFVERIDGSRSNVVGLPIERLRDALALYAKEPGAP